MNKPPLRPPTTFLRPHGRRGYVTSIFIATQNVDFAKILTDFYNLRYAGTVSWASFWVEAMKGWLKTLPEADKQIFNACVKNYYENTYGKPLRLIEKLEALHEEQQAAHKRESSPVVQPPGLDEARQIKNS